jgi:hypothetical protein
MKKLIFAPLLFLAAVCSAAFNTDYQTVTSSLTVNDTNSTPLTIQDTDTVQKATFDIQNLPLSGGFGPQAPSHYFFNRLRVDSGVTGSYYIIASTEATFSTTKENTYIYLQPPVSGAGGSIAYVVGRDVAASFERDGIKLHPQISETTATKKLGFVELSDNGSDYVFFRASDSISATTGWVLPAADGSQGGVFKTNGSGVTRFADDIGTFGITIDGGGSAITTGVKGDLTIPYACTILAWTLLADQSGSIVLDVWKDTLLNYPPVVGDSIAGTEKPTLSTATNNEDSNLTTWGTSVAAGDTIRFNVDSVTSVTRANLVVKVRKH